VSVAENGPLFTPSFDPLGLRLRPRMAGSLKYAHADVVYLAERWRVRGPSSSPVEKHFVLDAAGRADVLATLEEATRWLWLASMEPDWDGGALQFTFAGHGREPDGAVVLADGTLGPQELADVLARTARAAGRTVKVDLALDSCHSGAFLLGFMEASRDLPVEPRDMVAGSMHDEMAWEDGSLGHGLFTYCWSHEETPPGLLGTVGMRAIQPDNSLGPSTRVTAGTVGCSLLTRGRQNPVTHLDSEWSVCGSRIGPDQFDRRQIERLLVTARDQFRTDMEWIAISGVTFPDVRSDAEMAAIINEERGRRGLPPGDHLGLRPADG
jgi:hypothetical protein